MQSINALFAYKSTFNQSISTFGTEEDLSIMVSRLVDEKLQKWVTERFRLFHHILLQQALTPGEQMNLLSSCDEMRPPFPLVDPLNIVSFIPKIQQSRKTIALPFLATWPDKCDYYIIQLGGGEWRLQIGDFIDHAYPMSAMKLFVEGEALLVLGYFGRFEFFQDIQARQLPDGCFLFPSPVLPDNVAKSLKDQAPTEWSINLVRAVDASAVAFVLRQGKEYPVVRGYSEHDINLSSTNEGRNDIMIHQGEMEAELGELHFYGFCNDQSCLTLRELTPDEYGPKCRGIVCGHWI